MNLKALKGKTALVTGASSGLGSDFARHLAEAGCNLVLTARREDLLKALQQELTERHGVSVVVIALDLAEADAPDRLYERLKADGVAVDVLINNAGFGLYGDFLDIPWERERAMLELDILTLVHLTKRFAHDMVARRFGYILQVASIGAFQPIPTYASYSAAKSFVLSFGEALNHELKGTGVSCTVLSPGVTATEFLKVSGQAPTLYQRMAMMQSPTVTRIGLQALIRRRSSIVPGFLNAVTAWSTRLMPRSLAAAVAYRLMR